MRSPRSPKGLAILLVTAGVSHFLVPKQYDAIVPRSLPGKARTYTVVSGLAEFGVAAAVAHPKTRRLGGLAAAALFVAVFPANVRMALDWRRRPLPYRVVAWARLPLQLPLVLWGLRVSKR
jgi:uncharacterized membrane protein